MTAILSYLANWWRRPFDSGGSVMNWALFVFLVLILCAIWAQVLAPITDKTIKAIKEATP